MSKLNLDQRLRIIEPVIFDFVTRFDLPASWEDGRAFVEMKQIAQDINSEIPSEANEDYIKYLLGEMASKVRKGQTSRRLPATGVLIKALTAAKQSKLPEQIDTIARPEKSSEQIWADRINNGEAVSESVIFGQKGNELLQLGLITNDRLDAYKKSMFAAWENVHGKENAARLLQQKYATAYS